MLTLAQNFKIVEGAPLATDAAGRSSDIISMKYYSRCCILVSLTQGNAATVLITPRQATDVSGSGNKVIPAVPIFANLDTAAGDSLVRVADGANYTTDAGVKNKHVLFDIDVSQLDRDNGFDCIYVTTGASNVANLTGVLFFLAGSQRGATLPSAIID